jgi:hypothetical protein
MKMKNKCFIFSLLSFTIVAFYSCKNSEVKEVINNNEVEKKKTFIKIVGFLKEKKMDSLKPYFLYDSLRQKEFVLNNIAEGSYIASHSDETLISDSIKIKDSVIVQSLGQPIYKYYLRFYKDTSYVGIITMSFYSNKNDSPKNLFAERKFDTEIDTVGLLNEVMGN